MHYLNHSTNPMLEMNSLKERGICIANWRFGDFLFIQGQKVNILTDHGIMIKTVFLALLCNVYGKTMLHIS